MKIVLVLLFGIFITACTTMPKKDPYVRDYTPVDSKTYAYEDNYVRIEYTPITFESSVPVSIKSKSKSTIKILWDESAFINGEGESEKIFISSMRILEKDRSIPSSIIIPGTSLRESITPTSRAKWVYNSWDLEPICGEMVSYGAHYYSTAGVDIPVNKTFDDVKCVGKTFGLYIVIEINGTKNPVKLQYKLVGRHKSDAAPARITLK